MNNERPEMQANSRVPESYGFYERIEVTEQERPPMMWIRDQVSQLDYCVWMASDAQQHLQEKGRSQDFWDIKSGISYSHIIISWFNKK